MGDRNKNVHICVLYSSSLSKFSGLRGFENIFRRAVISVRNGEGTTIVFGKPSEDEYDSVQELYTLSVGPIHATASSSFEETLERFEGFLRTPDEGTPSSIAALLAGNGATTDRSLLSRMAYHAVLSRLDRSTSAEVLHLSKETEQRKEIGLDMNSKREIAKERAPTRLWYSWISQRLQSHKYESLSSAGTENSSGSRRRRSVLSWILVLTFMLVAILSTVAIMRLKRDRIYIRYDTSGSSGPRHQLRIYWQNASEWAKANPQDIGKWKVRIDDQAIIPAELYDDDEDRYQQWYRSRYPEVQQVVEDLNYVRPAWLGSLDMMVPWDSQFHFAHCVLALRRYWKAKESGKHVCGRDIDYAHISHCLDALEKRVFIDGPREEMDPPQYLYWQTRVCF